MGAPTAYVHNLGCRVNRVESDAIVRALAGDGFCMGGEDEADVIVVNTCAVTGEAEAKTRKAIRRALACPRGPWVVVTGCAVNLHPQEYAALGERVVVEPLKAQVARRAREALGRERAQGATPVAGPEPAPGSGTPGAAEAREVPDDPMALLGRARLGVKIQDGCNNRCSYCIVWKARGHERSVAADEVLGQVRQAAAAGVPEVVLTGVNLAAYWAEDPRAGGRVMRLEGLLDLLLQQTDIQQIRLSSLEPMDVGPGLLQLMAAAHGRVAPFLHLPLQAGCTSTLKRMRRPYTAERYEEICARCREAVPGIALSCDVIAGFPGETEEEFEATYALCERVAFARMHVFRYSARPGTPAAEAPDQVPPEVMAERAVRLRELGGRMARADAAARIGTVERAVLETGARGTLGSFHRVFVDELASAPAVPGASIGPADSEPSAPRLVEVAIIGQDADGLLHGRLVHPGLSGAPCAGSRAPQG